MAYSPSGKFIVVGMGSGDTGNEKMCGGMVVLNESDLTVVHEVRVIMYHRLSDTT